MRGLASAPGRPGRASSLLITHTSCMCTVKVLTKLKATDGGAATSIPQVCGGVRRWVGGSLAHATNRASLDSAPCTTEAAVLPSASRSSCSTSTPSRRSAPRTGASRSRCWCAASHHCASVCTDPSTRLTLGKACVVLMLCRAFSIPPDVHIRTSSSRRLTRTSARWQQHSMRPRRACTYRY